MTKEDLKKILLRLKNSETPSSLKFSKFKEILHPLLIKVIASKTTGDLIVDGKLPENTNCLIVANHLCIEDIPTLGQAIDKHFYLLVSDEDKKTIDGLGLTLNGVEWVHRLDKDSRRNSSNNAISILKQGKNFAMYPEATWNLSPNLFIMPMNYGCIRMALEANVPIVPVITFFTEEKRYTKIGEPFYPTINLEESIENLRDIMATAFYNLIQKHYKENIGKKEGIYCEIIDGEEYYYEKRENLNDDYWEDYVNKKYDAYKRAKTDKEGVREFESQFIFTPKTDGYEYFQMFNSKITNKEDKIIVKRISSEANGYNGVSFGEYEEKEHFGYGYNEKVLKKELKNKR